MIAKELGRRDQGSIDYYQFIYPSIQAIVIPILQSTPCLSIHVFQVIILSFFQASTSWQIDGCRLPMSQLQTFEQSDFLVVMVTKVRRILQDTSRQRKTATETDRQTATDKDRQRQTEKDRQRQTETERERERLDSWKNSAVQSLLLLLLLLLPLLLQLLLLSLLLLVFFFFFSFLLLFFPSLPLLLFFYLCL